MNMALNLNDRLLKLFECPVCLEYIRPPIFHCNLGHMICDICVMTVNLCPVCRGSIETCISCPSMEMVASQLSYPCTYESEGCDKNFTLDDMEDHECEYSEEYNCGLTEENSECQWSGCTFEFGRHIREKHSDSILYSANGKFEIPVTDKSHIICFDSGLFLVSIVIKSEPVKSYTFHVGQIPSTVEAKLYCYRMSEVPVRRNYIGFITKFRVDINQLARTGECLYLESDCDITYFKFQIIKLG